MDTSRINPWCRADVYTYQNETRELLTPPQQVDYVRIMSRVAIANSELQDAYLEHTEAHSELTEFMGRVSNGYGRMPES